MTARLVALDLPGGPRFVDELRRVWDRGDAAFPVDQRLPPPAKGAVIAAMAPASTIGADGDESRLDAGRPVEPGDALVVATSGSTGASRGAVLTHDAIESSARATSERLGVTGDDHWLACLPLSHVGGLSVITRALVTGVALTVHPSFDAVAVMAAADDGATLTALVPTALARVDASRFRTIVIGGGRPPADRPANTVATYGMTETGSGVVYDGRPLDGVDIRMSEAGEINLRCPMLLRAYRDGTDPLVDGWFATGDLGEWRDDGRLHVVGRRSDLIITGGENVWPEPVEAVLAGHPAVADVAVVGAPDAVWGELVVALVVSTDQPTLDELRDHVKQQLPTFCAPRILELVPSIPRTTLGKIRREALRRTLREPGRIRRDR